MIEGLLRTPKRIPSKFFYDERGSRIFEAITELPEYYPTRTERRIMCEHLQEIADAIGPEVHLIEFGSGVGEKVRMLLGAMKQPVAYTPIDISREVLVESAIQLSAEYPDVEILPVCADYTQFIQLPKPQREPHRRVVFFPGSTIGNCEPTEAKDFLKRTRAIVGDDGALLIGIDLKKDPKVLHDAYNDTSGVTAEFNLNLIERIRKEFDIEIEEDAFEHYAFYNQDVGRIEMHLVSTTPQVLQLSDERIEFARGEHVVTEYSYKYEVKEFESRAAEVGFTSKRTWVDADGLFAVMYCESDTGSAGEAGNRA